MIIQISYTKYAADLQEQATGPESSLTQIYRFATAHLLYHAGDYPQAMSQFETVHNACRRLLGNHNHLTLTSLFAYGMLQWINGDGHAAEKSIRACIHESKTYLWSVEQQARAQYYFSRLLRSIGEVEEAQVFEMRAEETKAELLLKYPEFLARDEEEEEDEDGAVYDRMVPIGRMRFSGGLHGGKGIDWG